MKRILALVILVSLQSVNSLFALTGREIIEKTEKLAKPKSIKNKIAMIIQKGSSVMEKEFMLYQKTYDDGDKAMITFTKPTQIQVLTHTHKTREDDQWVKLTSGKIKRLAGGEKNQSFVQSHLTYEDMESRDIDKYDFNNTGEETVNGDVCYKVDAVKKIGNKSYDKNTLYIRKADFVIVRIDFYQKGKLVKYLENKNIKKIDGIFTPHLVTITMADDSGKTELIVKKVVYNAEIADEKFSREALR
jgi:hypothetical protein